MADEAKDNRPDVEVRSKARKNSNEGEWYLEIQHEAVCRFGCGAFMSPDVVQIVNWANAHIASDSHMLAKCERLGIQPHWLVTLPEHVYTGHEDEHDRA